MSEVVLTIESDSGRHRAQVVKVSEAAFRIDIFRQFDDFDAGGNWHGKFWSPWDQWRSYADSVERATEIAAENLRNSEASD